ncbi:MAG TPA: VOC family protein [Gemmatimonadaceae bacterium]|nr:VOC family protein [Gemmatimonadaceae bacterium]
MPPAAMESTSGASELRRIGQIAILVQDVERAVRFYRDTLGITLLFQADPGLAFFDCGGVRLMLSRPEGDGNGAGTSILYYTVDDIQQAHTTLAERGVHFVAPPHRVAQLADHDLWMAFCRDSEENLLALMSEVRR